MPDWNGRPVQASAASLLLRLGQGRPPTRHGCRPLRHLRGRSMSTLTLLSWNVNGRVLPLAPRTRRSPRLARPVWRRIRKPESSGIPWISCDRLELLSGLLEENFARLPISFDVQVVNVFSDYVDLLAQINAVDIRRVRRHAAAVVGVAARWAQRDPASAAGAAGRIRCRRNSSPSSRRRMRHPKNSPSDRASCQVPAKVWSTALSQASASTALISNWTTALSLTLRSR